MGILDGVVEWISEQIMHGLDLINTSVLGALGCGMETFLRYFPAAETMYDIFTAIGIGLILLMWVWNLFKNYWLGAGFEAEHPVKLTFRAIIFITLNIGGYGCGPTCMAMVVSSLTDDLVDPVEMAKWSYEHGYWCSGSGSYHALIPAAAEAWGLPVSGCTASEPQRITDALSSGKLVVAIMSAGHFTSSGHFIVLRGVKDEKILVADPANRTRSEQSWELSIILNEASKAAGSGGPFWIIG